MKALVAALLLLVVSSAFAQSISERAANDQTIDMRNEELLMQRAFERARASLDDFLIKSKQPPPGTSSYALKVAVRDGSNTEYFWVNQFSWSDESFSGRINNEPRTVKAVKFGQAYTFSRSQIVDWMYIDEKSRKTIGNFTACAIVSKQPPAEAEEFKRRYGLECP